MSEDGRRAFELNHIQYDFVYDDSHKFTAFIGGLGSGKSFAGGVKALRYMVEHPGSLGCIGAPTFPQLRDSTMRSFFDDILPPNLIADFNKTDGVLRLTNGSECLFRSMDDPDRRRGPNLAWVWLDEGPLCGYYAWKVMKGRLRQSGYAPLAWITGTPKGEDEFYEDFEAEPKPNHKLYRASTHLNAHNLPDNYVEDLGYTGQFALQEVEGLFVNFEGLVYELRKEWHFGEWPGDYADGTPRRPALRIGGIDWGFANPAVALPLWVDHDDRVYLLDEYYERNKGLNGGTERIGEGGQSKAILDFTQKYGIQTWYAGPDEPEHISDLNAMFGKLGVKSRVVAAQDEIVHGIETVRQYMALRKDGTAGFRLSARCPMTRSEFRTYSYPSARAKGDPLEKPLKKNDHAMDALRYALHSALGGAFRSRQVPQQEMERLRDKMTEIGGVSILRRTF